MLIKMSIVSVSSLLVNAQRNLYLDDLPAVGAKLDEFTVVSVINEPYGIYGYATALAALSAQGHMIIIFKGTDDLSDVIADIESFVQESWPEVDSKARFVNGLLDVFKEFFVPWLATIPNIQRAKKITLTGHSAGATFALLAGIWISIFPKPRLTIKPVIYAYAAPIFGNQAAKQLMERLGLEIYDLVTEDDPVPALSLPGFVRVGNGPKAPQRNFILNGPVNEPKLVTPENSVIPWYINPLKVSRHSLISTYIPMLKNVLAGEKGVKCTYSASAVRNDPLKACSASRQCVMDGALKPCGSAGWCGSNGLCIAKQVPYKCSTAKDCVAGSEMCIMPGYQWPTSSWDAISEPCKLGATCSLNPWDLTRYCWNK